jgi:pimeloyl-ACP methyl ester carboxylesterase
MTDSLQRASTDLRDVRLHYVTAGEGPAIVVLHGWPQTWFMWRDTIPGLAKKYRVVASDLRRLGDSSKPPGGYHKKTIANDIRRLMHDVLGEKEFFVVGHDWGGPVAFSLAAQHREGVRRMVIFDVPVPGDGTPVMFNNRWHHGLHWEIDFPEELTAGREDVDVGFFYRTWGARPGAISQEAQQEYFRCYRQPGAMKAGFNYYRATPQDVKDNEAFLAQGKLPMPILCWGGAKGRGRGALELESWQRVATNVRGGVVEDAGHWIPEEKPEWATQEILKFFGEES